jgi:hypothetical protein
LIKENTTPGKGKAISIPGQSKENEKSFENALFTVLSQQESSVRLFVKQKSNEIHRRLDHLEKQLRNLQLTTWPPSMSARRVPRSRLDKYSRIEEQALEAGNEIRSLSRFAGAQRLAFTKLLKKYRKWTGSDALISRFNSEVLSQPNSFTQLNLEPHLEQWTALLYHVRAAMGDMKRREDELRSPALKPMSGKNAPTSAATVQRIQQGLESGVDVDFDTTLANVPLGKNGARAVYWVHPEQLVEVQVLLMEHMKLSVSRKSSTSNAAQGKSPTISRRDSAANRDGVGEYTYDTGLVVLDDLEDFARLENSIPVSESEDFHGHRPQAHPAATARWTSTDGVVISVSDELNTRQNPGTQAPSKLKHKHLGAFLDYKKPFKPSSSGSATPVESQPKYQLNDLQDLDNVRTWLSDHCLVKPLAAILSKRVRMTSIPVGKNFGQWAILDHDVKLKPLSKTSFDAKDWTQNIHGGGYRFPFAVLEVRQEGENETDIIKVLDQTHLVSHFVPLSSIWSTNPLETERIRGFSLAAQAVWECQHPQSMTPPFWVSALKLCKMP